MWIPLIVVCVALIMMGVEYRKPGRDWPRVKGWWTRALLFNGVQAGMVYAAGYLWDGWMQTHRLWEADAMGTTLGAVLGYFVLTFIYYWWHRVRHQNGFLWRWFHQFHHSPQRLEIVTSFYKHPFEIAANALLSSAVMYLVVGLSAPAAAGATLLAGLAELFYHWNVKTPHWLGYVVQRPESHCVHHEEGIHHYNYGDLPIWDMLFGTFHNPKTFESRCGFGEQEHEIGAMLAGHDVVNPKPQPYRARVVALGILGLLGMTGHALANPQIKGLAAMTAASPAPKVFTSHQGLETFSTSFQLRWQSDEQQHTLDITPLVYKALKGPYNRRNVYGAILAYGPVLATNPTTQLMFDQVAGFALCPDQGAIVLRELGIDPTGAREVSVIYTPLEATPKDLPRIITANCASEAL